MFWIYLSIAFVCFLYTYKYLGIGRGKDGLNFEKVSNKGQLKQMAPDINKDKVL